MLSELVKSVRVVPEVYTKTPGNEEVDIVEIELDPKAGDDHSQWFHWMDHLRFRCDRRSTKYLLKALGIDGDVKRDPVVVPKEAPFETSAGLKP